MPDFKVSSSDIKEALKREWNEIRAADAQEENLISADGTDEYEDTLEELEEEITPGTGILSLAEIPIEEWDSIRVSPLSLFGDGLWDFTCYPNAFPKGAKVSFDYVNSLGINLVSSQNLHWLRIAKALCFYSIPHFNMHSAGRSYGSLASWKTKILRILSLFQSESLYLDEHSAPSFRTINDLSQHTIDAFIEELPTPGIRWEMAHITHVWQKLSSQGLLPPQYCVFENFISKQSVSKQRDAYDSSVKPWAPIHLDDFAAIVNHCIQMVTVYSKDILWLYQTYYPTLVGAFNSPEKMRLHPTGVSTGSEEGVAAFRSYAPVKSSSGQAWWPLRVLERSHALDSGEYIAYSGVARLVASLVDSCCVIILATSGMRRSEVMGLRSGCLSRDEDGHWLAFSVFKTSAASQGDSKKIPVPAVTAEAILVLERLGRESRLFGKHDYLFSTITRQHFGNRTHAAYPERATTRVAEATGADVTIHPHRFRKTLAVYMIHLDSRNIELIRAMFSHKSLKMTLRYIISLPGVHDEVKANLVERNSDILTEVLQAAMKGSIGGIGGQRITETLQQSPNFKANLQDKFKETIGQYVSSLLEAGVKLLHRTNLAICLKTPGIAATAPCDGINEPAIDKLHPNTFACDPFNCRFAVFTEDHVTGLKNEIIFHENLIRHPYVGDRVREDSHKRILDASRRLAEVIGTEAHEEFLAHVSNA